MTWFETSPVGFGSVAKDISGLPKQLFRTWGPLQDAATGIPLFNQNAWKAAQGILRTIKDGFVSDPPGVALYMQIGVDADDLPVYFCCRGTNISEGAVHRPILHVFPSTGVGVRHAILSLAAFILRHNFNVGTRNRTGIPYKSHFNITLKNQLHLLLHATSNLIPDQDLMHGWVNGTLYETTSERIGIALVPDRLRIDADMLPYSSQAKDGTKHHHFLAKSQGTLHAVMPVCTDAEKQLFGNLMKTNQSLQSNDFQTVAKLWNSAYADGEKIFYKVCSLNQVFLYLLQLTL
jgi:hypothetical protein